MSKNLTPWFPADVEPIHIGWYERMWSEKPHKQKIYSNDWWDGKVWWLGNYSGEKFCETDNDMQWRGLAEKP